MFLRHVIPLSLPGFFCFAQPLTAATPADKLPAADPRVRIEGRAEVTAGGVRLGFPGVTFHLRYRGTALAMRVKASNDENYFDVLVDEHPPVRLRTRSGVAVYPLLPAGTQPIEHTLQIVRRTESWQGTCEVLGFEPGPGGVWLPPPAAPTRKLLFIGDSVTGGEVCAYDAADPLNGRAAGLIHAANARLSYGKVLARRLAAESHLVSYGGRGILRDWQGLRDVVNAPELYERSLPDDSTTAWDHRRYVPDAIGVALGTNDFSSGVPDQAEFVATYVAFVRKLRGDAPQAWIFLLESPILEDAPGGPPKRTLLRSYLDAVIVRLHDDRVRLAPVRRYPGLPHNGHPVASEHAAMADELEPLFRRALGW